MDEIEYMQNEMGKRFEKIISELTFDELIETIKLFALVGQDSTDFKEELRRRCESPIVKAMKESEAVLEINRHTMWYKPYGNEWIVRRHGDIQREHTTESEAIDALLG